VCMPQMPESISALAIMSSFEMNDTWKKSVF